MVLTQRSVVQFFLDMVRIAFISSLAVALMLAQAVLAEVVPTGTYRIVKGAQHVSDVRGRSGQPVALTPPYTAIKEAQKWDIINSTNDTVIIQNKKSKLYLSVSEPFINTRAVDSIIKVESQAHEWELEYSANQDAYFIQYAGAVGIGRFVVYESEVKAFPTQLSLQERFAYEDSQVWKLHRPQCSVCSYLTPKALAACVRVSRQWRELFTPYLWSDIRIDDDQKSLFRKAYMQRAFRRHRELIRAFATTSETVLDLFYYLFENVNASFKARKKPIVRLKPEHKELPETQLRKLDLCWSGPTFRNRREEEDFDSREQWSCDGDWGDDVWDQSALLLIWKSPHLVDLTLNLASFSHGEITFGKQVPALKRLEISGFRDAIMFSSSFTGFFDTLPSQLEELTLDCDVFFSDDERNSKGNGNGAAADDASHMLKALRILSLKSSMLDIPLPIFTRLLKRCPMLRELRLTGEMRFVKARQIPGVLYDCCPELNRLVVRGVKHTINDQGLATLLSGTQTARWKSVEIEAPLFGPQAAASLLVHAPTLEHLTIRHGGLPADDVHTLLATAPNLRTLSLLSDRTPENQAYCLKPPPPSWICACSLEVLRINTRPEKWKDSARNNLLQQLGSMAKLRVLQFRNGSKAQQGFCDFSLESGALDRLQDLKELEEFHLESFRHKIGPQEQSWMTTHWPRLKNLHLWN
ncbi:hypothetical protein BGZ70_001257 [Mortierella alpina]|uniref:F-box domain-containing protein n=1 Tax=Mortierella alpina TaxID=64518 RepID=A0A9P6IW58_MORAP|nr:hypothetical protein BGZ70_001257 [Mortierella alpina]